MNTKRAKRCEKYAKKLLINYLNKRYGLPYSEVSSRFLTTKTLYNIYESEESWLAIFRNYPKSYNTLFIVEVFNNGNHHIKMCVEVDFRSSIEGFKKLYELRQQELKKMFISKGAVMNYVSRFSPWVIYVAKLKKFFERDDDISIEYDPINDKDCVYIKVKDPNKYYALSLLMETEIVFGKFHLQIFVMPTKHETVDNMQLFKILFKDSHIVESMDTIQPDGSSNSSNYISFKNEVVKYWTGNLGNPHGNSFTLYETLANDIFEDHEGVMFTTADDNYDHALKNVIKNTIVENVTDPIKQINREI